MTKRERLERKLQKRRQWAAARRDAATQRFAAADAAVVHIPLGQPILVGHHSEKAHRAIWRDEGLLRKKRRKHQTKQCLREVKKLWRLFEQT